MEKNNSFYQFSVKIQKVGMFNIVLLPKEISVEALPSRGMVLVEGSINGLDLKAVLEPDGKGSHWFSLDNSLLKKLSSKINDTVTLNIRQSNTWPEPNVPQDIQKALLKDTKASNLWNQVTPMARWDWIRWIRSTKNPETRKHRIEVACSKLKKGTRRPCCFNRSMCTEPDISHNGVLVVAH